MPWCDPEFPVAIRYDNWAKLEESEERNFPWQQPIVDEESRSPEARRKLGYTVLRDEDKNQWMKD